MRNVAMVVTVFAVMLPGCAFLQDATKYHPHEDSEASKPLVLDPGAEKVRTGKSDAPFEYKQIGSLSVQDGEGCGGLGTRGSMDRALIRLRNDAAAQGADYVQMLTISTPYSDGDCFHDEYVITGMSFKKP